MTWFILREDKAMALSVPQKERDYIGPATDTRAWDRFELRPGDVIVSTPPKAGTTWMQTIALMLIQGVTELEKSIWYYSPWIDCAFRPQSPELLDAQTTRRCMKTHTPFDGIGFSPDATYLAVYRHPVDIHIVRSQRFWDRWLPDLREGLAHLVGLIMRRICGEASAGFRWSFV